MDKTVNITLGKMIGAFLTLGIYTTAVCIFFYNLNESSIREWKEEHRSQIDKIDQRLESNEAKWREMFSHFNCRIDNVAGKQ